MLQLIILQYFIQGIVLITACTQEIRWNTFINAIRMMGK